MGAARGALRVVGLFAGIGGLEHGLQLSGPIESVLLCERDEAAQAVLREHFPDIPIAPDVRALRSIPACDLVVAGFPCQDLSQAGKTAGIEGAQSGLVSEVFRLVDGRAMPRWLLIENVPFLLALDRGQAMDYIVEELESRGMAWAYRVIDSRAFGLPQRRKRVLLLASRTEDPRTVLFADDEPRDEPRWTGGVRPACGFYWTEGLRGLGWCVDGVPTLKGGSTIGIPSPPAVWLPDGRVVVVDIADAERLQGFPAGWTRAARGKGARWKLVGNAVSTLVAAYIGRRLREPAEYDHGRDRPLVGRTYSAWPDAAWGASGQRQAVAVSHFPVSQSAGTLAEFLRSSGEPLSPRAAQGFLARAHRSTLRFPPGLLLAVERCAGREAGRAVA